MNSDDLYYEPLRHVVEPHEDGWKLRTILQTRMLISRQLLVRLKRLERGILVNGERKYVDFHVQTGDLVEVRMAQEQSDDLLPQPMPLHIVHEDTHVMVVDKPPGLIVHPTHGHYIHTLANGVVHHWQTNGVRARFRAVNRIDQYTSGLVLIAKTPFAHQFVSLQLRAHTVQKEYVAIVRGAVAAARGTVDAPIERAPDNPHRRAVISGGAPSVTHYEVLERLPHLTMLGLRLETGRTHQIRVHMEHLGHPLLGDDLYGTPYGPPQGTPHGPPHGPLQGPPLIARQALHARTLGFVHPGTRTWSVFSSPLPADMVDAWTRACQQFEGNEGIER